MALSAKDMRALASAKWKSSGLTDAHAKALGLAPLPADQVGRVSAKLADTCALLIPYFDPKGRRTKFFRLRRLQEPQGFEAQSGKAQKYAQPAGTAPEVYLPPLLKRSWRAVLDDPSAPLIITEGELKAACACAHGFTCLGLGGVDSWRSRRLGVALVEALATAQWKGRPVTIVYDSDSATNPDVVRAAHGLAGELRARGAEVAVASLPPRADGGKQGLDDLLVAEGREALERAIDEAVDVAEGNPLWKLNEEVVFVRDPGLVLVREPDKDGKTLRLGPDQFVRHHFANRRHEVVDAEGKPKTMDTAKEWMRWPHRFECRSLAYEPGKPRVYDGCFNMWTGLGVEPEEGDVKPFQELVDFVARGLRPHEVKWLWQWMAYPLRHLGEKMYSCVALWSPVHGVGKTLVAYVLKDIYGRNGVEIRNKDLDSSFNTYVENRQFVIGDEITGSDSRGFADQLKGLITQEHVRVNAKYVPEYTVADRANWFFTSNHADAFYLDDTDRRFFVHHVEGKPREKAFYERVDAWRGPEGDRRGARRLLKHLLTKVSLEGFSPKAPPPVTASKEAMAYDAKSDAARWVADLKHDPSAILRLGDAPLAKDLWTPSELLAIYDPTGSKGVKAGGLGRELVKVFPRLPKAATAHGSQQLYAVRNVDRWTKATPKERAAHWGGPTVKTPADEAKERF